MDREVLARATELTAANVPFALATVVWSREPSSGKGGGMALIEMDGSVTGWIGGACAEPAVVGEARRAIKDGRARLVHLGPDDEEPRREGILRVPISCASEGALEVFLDPVLPSPTVVVVGGSPSVHVLAGLLDVLDWSVIVVDDGGEAASYPSRATVHTTLAALDRMTVPAGAAVVVATQGHYDEPALESALASDASYIGLVASRKRAETVLGYLADRGHPPEQLGRIETPAGLDLGHIQHREIAVAVLATLVARRARGELRGASATPPAPASAIDPICGMEVVVEDARFVAEVDGRTWYFCCPACRSAYLAAHAGTVDGGEA